MCLFKSNPESVVSGNLDPAVVVLKRGRHKDAANLCAACLEATSGASGDDQVRLESAHSHVRAQRRRVGAHSVDRKLFTLAVVRQMHHDTAHLARECAGDRW